MACGKDLIAGAVTAILLSAGPVAAQDDWQFAVRINGWFPDVSGETAFTPPGGDDEFSLNVEDVLDKVEFAALFTVEARKGRWGLFSDLVYSSVGDDASEVKARPLGRRQTGSLESTIDVDLDVDTWVWMAAGFYRVLQSDSLTLDLLAGMRYIDVEQELGWTVNSTLDGQSLPQRQGNIEVAADNWDAIVGVRGRIPLTDSGLWFVPFYLDGGAGDSDFTWQGATGIGYSMGRAKIGLVWRHLEYDLGSDAELAEIELDGPAAEFEFTW